jgi:hypothetical protein
VRWLGLNLCGNAFKLPFKSKITEMIANNYYIVFTLSIFFIASLNAQPSVVLPKSAKETPVEPKSVNKPPSVPKSATDRSTVPKSVKTPAVPNVIKTPSVPKSSIDLPKSLKENTIKSTKAKPTPSPVGGQLDSNGCLTSSGYSWCAPLKKCIRPWETPCAVKTSSKVTTSKKTSSKVTDPVSSLSRTVPTSSKTTLSSKSTRYHVQSIIY